MDETIHIFLVLIDLIKVSVDFCDATGH